MSRSRTSSRGQKSLPEHRKSSDPPAKSPCRRRPRRPRRRRIHLTWALVRRRRRRRPRPQHHPRLRRGIRLHRLTATRREVAVLCGVWVPAEPRQFQNPSRNPELLRRSKLQYTDVTSVALATWLYSVHASEVHSLYELSRSQALRQPSNMKVGFDSHSPQLAQTAQFANRSYSKGPPGVSPSPIGSAER